MRLQTLQMPVFLALLTLALAACGDRGGEVGGGAAAGGAESPPALVAQAKSLLEKGDMRGVVGLIAPQDRPLMSVGLLMFSKMAPLLMGGLGEAFGGVTGGEAKAKMAEQMKPFNEAMAATLSKHGLGDVDLDKMGADLRKGTPEAAAAWIQEKAPDLDHAAFVADVLTAVSKLGDKAASASKQGFERLKGKLEDMKIDGDHATGTLGGKPGEFVRVAGRWYFSVRNQRGHERE